MLLATILTTGLLSACFSTPSATATASTAPETAAVSSPPIIPSQPPATLTPAFQYTPVISTPTPTAKPQVVQRPAYDFEISYDPTAQKAEVKQRVIYTNQSSETLNQFQMVVEAARKAGVFSLQSVIWPDGTPVENAHLEDDRLIIPLVVPLVNSRSVSFEINYVLTLPEAASLLGYTANQAAFIDWYPYFPPYLSGQGWVIEPAGRVGEHLVYPPADFKVTIRVPDTAAGLIIAASAPGEVIGNNIHQFNLQNARTFSWSASSKYQVVTAYSGNITVNGYVFPEHVESGKAAAVYTAEALTLFSSLFTPYPRDTFSFVEVEFADGQEGDGIFYLNKSYFAYTSGVGSGLGALSAHEVAHQWWFSAVGSNQARYPWLDEALCTYSELLYYQNLHPELVEWWWQYRVDSYNATGWVNSSIYDFQAYRPYVNAVYLRGARFLDEIHQQMGNEAFISFLHSYAVAYAGKLARPEDFIALLRQSDSADIQPILDKYFGN
ncbi:MAG: M1 family metallopeptidase [Anaerolineae bacterium]|nr:M1 family metallopeptidase [Anaerolineae bacterium]